jgi:hypothetical protein
MWEKLWQIYYINEEKVYEIYNDIVDKEKLL